MIRTLTPVHVGSGDSYTRLEFVISDGKVVFVNVLRLLEELGKLGIDQFKVAEDVGSGRAGIEDYIEDIEKFKIREVPFTGRRSGEKILKHVQTSGRPYIPGSLVVDAIRSVVLWKVVREDGSTLSWLVGKMRRQKRIDSRRLESELEAKVFRVPVSGAVRAVDVCFDSVRVYEVIIDEDSVLVECIDRDALAEKNVEMDDLVLRSGERIDFDDIRGAAREFAEMIADVCYSGRAREEVRKLARRRNLVLRVGLGCWRSAVDVLLNTHPEFEDVRRKFEQVSFRAPVTCDDLPLGWIELR